MNARDRNATRTWQPRNLFRGLATTPEDEFTEDITSFSEEFKTQNPEPIDEGGPDVPYEMPVDEVMEVLTTNKTTGNKKKRFRVPAILSAPTPDQLKSKINTYLEKLETDPRLEDLDFEDLQFSSNDQGYSCMVLCSMTF